MFEILIDTNIYRKDPAQVSLPFKALARLCKAGTVRLHIPYVVLREFQTQQIDLYRKEIEAAFKGVSGVLGRRLSDGVRQQLEGVKSAVKESMPTVEYDAANGIVAWAEEIDAVLHPLDAEDAVRAMEAYFTGQPPLKEPKVRKDIPDAFILQSALTILKSASPLYVISEDGAFGEAASAVDGITVLKSLNDFIELPGVQAALAEQDQWDKLALVVGSLKASADQLETAFAGSLGEKVMSKKIHSKEIPDDNHEATISQYGEPENMEFDFSQTAYYGDGQVGLSFTCNMTVLAFYYIYKADYYALDEEDMPSVSDHNDHYYEAESEFDIVISGTISVNVDLDEVSADKEVDEYVDFDSVEIDDITDIDLVDS